jgi:hypothetical protein
VGVVGWARGGVHVGTERRGQLDDEATYAAGATLYEH